MTTGTPDGVRAADGPRPHAQGAGKDHPDGVTDRSGRRRFADRPWVRRLAARRDRLRSNPRTRGPYRIGVGLVGGLVTLVGLLTVPLPGQGWLTVFLGLAILSTEFDWARRLRVRGIELLQRWTAWLKRQGLLVRGAVLLATCLVVALATWGALALTGVPGWVPASLVPPLPGLEG